MFRRSLVIVVCVLVLLPRGWCTCGAASASCPDPACPSPRSDRVKPSTGCACRHGASGEGRTNHPGDKTTARGLPDQLRSDDSADPPDRHSPDCGTVTSKLVPNGILSATSPVTTAVALLGWVPADPVPVPVGPPDPVRASPLSTRTPVYLSLNVLRN